MKVEGGCHCGAITYEAEVDPALVSICHCTDCQILSGAPYRASVATNAAQFTITRGAPKVYVKTAESGNKRAQGFCAACGTSIYSSSADAAPSIYMLRVGGIAQREQLVPKKQIWRQSAQPWTAHIDELESHERGLSAPVKT